jgi:hypothetical protein
LDEHVIEEHEHFASSHHHLLPPTVGGPGAAR